MVLRCDILVILVFYMDFRIGIKMKVGKTTDSEGRIVEVFECPYCHMRTKFEERLESHDCKRYSDALAESKEK